MRHLQDNFHKKFPHKDLVKLLWTAARATTPEAFNETLTEMTKINTKAVPWLLEHAHPRHWATAFFEGKRYGHLTSNIAEALNSAILPARELPIIPLFETIRHQLMDWFTECRQSEANTQGVVVKYVAQQIQEQLNHQGGRRYRWYENTPVCYEVQSSMPPYRDYRVDLALRTCTCLTWQSQGYPCSHACAIIIGRKENPQEYTESFFTLNEYKRTWEATIMHPHSHSDNHSHEFVNPLPPSRNPHHGIDTDSDSNDNELSSDSESESEVGPLPPKVRRQPGRPRKERTDAEKERRKKRRGNVGRIQKCGLCSMPGHSKRTCTQPPVGN